MYLDEPGVNLECTWQKCERVAPPPHSARTLPLPIFHFVCLCYHNHHHRCHLHRRYLQNSFSKSFSFFFSNFKGHLESYLDLCFRKLPNAYFSHTIILFVTNLANLLLNAYQIVFSHTFMLFVVCNLASDLLTYYHAFLSAI